MFIEKIRDCYLTQHIREITRLRGEQGGSKLDLLFTNDESIIEDVVINSTLGRSDHGCEQVKCDLQELEAKSKKFTYMYEKADYQRMKECLNLNWESLLSPHLTTEEKWNKFSEKLIEVIEECVPKKVLAENTSRKRTNNSLMMNRRLWKKIRQKQ